MIFLSLQTDLFVATVALKRRRLDASPGSHGTLAVLRAAELPLLGGQTWWMFC